MDVIWKRLAENDPSCTRLSLFSQQDVGTGATFAVRCQTLLGVTSAENFANDAMYFCEGVFPLNQTLTSVELEWNFLSHLSPDQQDYFIRGIASLQAVEEIIVRSSGIPVPTEAGQTPPSARCQFQSLLIILECACRTVRHLSIEVGELIVEDPAEVGVAALLLLRCKSLEAFHLRGLKLSENFVANNRTDDGVDPSLDLSILFSALAKLPALHSLHISRNEENPKALQSSCLRDFLHIPHLTSISLMNMGLTDKHCKIFRRYLTASRSLHSLILVDNPGITEKGHRSLLRLLESNRSLFNSTFGTDSETQHRTSQLVYLHLNRCGRSKLRTPLRTPTPAEDWISYLARINETVPEELELDTLFVAFVENPDLLGITVDHLSFGATKNEQAFNVSVRQTNVRNSPHANRTQHLYSMDDGEHIHNPVLSLVSDASMVENEAPSREKNAQLTEVGVSSRTCANAATYPQAIVEEESSITTLSRFDPGQGNAVDEMWNWGVVGLQTSAVVPTNTTQFHRPDSSPSVASAPLPHRHPRSFPLSNSVATQTDSPSSSILYSQDPQEPRREPPAPDLTTSYSTLVGENSILDITTTASEQLFEQTTFILERVHDLCHSGITTCHSESSLYSGKCM